MGRNNRRKRPARKAKADQIVAASGNAQACQDEQDNGRDKQNQRKHVSHPTACPSRIGQGLPSE